jgi:hypothetical protein
MKISTERKRMVVKLVAATGSATAVYSDGRHEHITFSGNDIMLGEASPTQRCQDCGHAESLHGDWDWDGTDEYWRFNEEGCGVCECPTWMDFTPRKSWEVNGGNERES